MGRSIEFFVGVVLLGLSHSAQSTVVTTVTGQTFERLDHFSIVSLDGVGSTQWIHLDRTQGMSFEYVTSQLGAGGTFEGYRHASRAEVGALTTLLFGWNWASLVAGVEYAYASYPSMAGTFFGLTSLSPGNPEYLDGMTSDIVGNVGGYDLVGTLVGQGIADWYGAPAAYMDNAGTRFTTSEAPLEGHFLVREIPLPASFWLTLLGFLALSLSRLLQRQSLVACSERRRSPLKGLYGLGQRTTSPAS